MMTEGQKQNAAILALASRYCKLNAATWEKATLAEFAMQNLLNFVDALRESGLAARRAVPAQASAAEGYALVPLKMTRAMRDVTDEEDWQWEDLLAAADSITEDQYNEIAAAPAPLQGGQSEKEKLYDYLKVLATEAGFENISAAIAQARWGAPGGEPSARVAVGPLAVQRIPLKQPMDGASLARDGTGRDWVLLQGTAQIRYLDQYERNFVHSAIDAALAAAHAPAQQGGADGDGN